MASFRAEHIQRGRDELASFRDEPSLATAIKRAALAKTRHNKRYSHQNRLAAITLENVHAVLAHAPLANCRDFAELHAFIREAIGGIDGVGELMIYDTALRIGAHLGILPVDVYLHRGTREGARALGIAPGLSRVGRSMLPWELQTLEPYKIEDFLCVFKNELKKLNANKN